MHNYLLYLKQIKADWLWTSVLFACYNITQLFGVTEKKNNIKKAKKRRSIKIHIALDCKIAKYYRRL
jgi:hypothetical protein